MAEHPPRPAGSGKASVEIKDLEFAWSRSDAPCLAIPSLTIGADEKLFLYGPSGSGKSTLLHVLTGILQADKGSVCICGTDISRLGANARDRFRARHLGIIFQQFNLIPYLSVLDNFRLARHFSAGDSHHIANEATEFMTQLGLAPTLLQRRPGSLSMGQQQRVAVIRALINHPALIIADEPTSALDMDARDTFIDLLMQVSSQHHSAVLFVSHDRSLASHFDRALDIREINQAWEDRQT